MQADTGAHVELLRLLTIEVGGSVIAGHRGLVAQQGLHLLEAVRTDDHAHVEERVRGESPVLVDPAELDEGPAELQVGPCIAVALQAVIDRSADGAGGTETLGTDLLQVDGLDRGKHVERRVAGQQELGAEVRADDDALAQREELLDVDRHLEVAVVMLGDDIRRAVNVGLDVGAPGRVVLVVARVEDDAGLELQMLTAILLGGRNNVVLDVEVKEGEVVRGDQALVDGMPGADVPVGRAGSPAPVAVLAEFALEHQEGTEDVAAHQVEPLPVRDLVQFRHVQGGSAVESVEIVGLVAEVGHVGGDADAGNQVLAVKESVIDGVALGIPGGLHVDLPLVVGIDGAVSVLVDVGQGAVVPAEIGGVADGGQRAEVDAGFLDFFLRVDRRQCGGKQDHDSE